MQRAHVLAIYFHLLETVLRKIRLQVVEEGSCLLWQGAIDTGSPVMAMPYRRLGQGGSEPAPGQIRVRELMLEIFTHKRPPPRAKTPRSIVVSTSCCNPPCVCPDCAGYMPRGLVQKRGFANMDMAKEQLRRKRIMEKKRHIRALTDDQVSRIKTELSTSARALAREMGLNFSVVRNCRVGRTYRDFTASPWSGLG